MTLKEKRKEIYDFIEEHIGKIPDDKIGILSEKIKNYAKAHNLELTQNLTAALEKCRKYRKQLGKKTRADKKRVLD